jgi:lysyl-tRNA synthetase class 2
MEYLKSRHRFMRIAESWFDAHGYTQLPMPALLPSVNPEAHIALTEASGGWLSPSPELQMKRMLAGGFERIVSIGPVFRAREVSTIHNPEFTMAEWYHSWAPLETILDELEDLVTAIWRGSLPTPELQKDGLLRLANGRTIRMDARPWPRVPICDIIQKALGLDMHGVVDTAELYALGLEHGRFTKDHAGERFEQLFTRLWERCEHTLDYDTPVFITEWPAPLASLARLSPDNPAVTLRAELLIAGVELANGFEELTDPAEQRARFGRDMETRRGLAGRMEAEKAGSKELQFEISDHTPPQKPTNHPAPLAIDEKFLEALDAGLPPCAGMALGFDRLCMLFTGAEEIRQVLPFAGDEL